MIKEIINQVKIEDIIAQYIRIENTAHADDYRALCPFHLDKNPSFSINTIKQVFYCYGCKEGGNVIKFISMIEKITKAEAIELLRIKLGINSEVSELQVLEKVSEYFSNKRILQKEFFDKRSMSELHQVKYSLGYSGSDILDLSRTFPEYIKELSDLQLIHIKYKDTPAEMRQAFFLNRIMIPIKNHLGTVGFAGRTLIDNPNKYLNSQESKYFKRRFLLYGLDKTCIDTARKENRMFLVEGFFDVQRMQIKGHFNTVGSLGTGLTLEQAKIIKRFCSHVIIGYDGDSAGIKATVSAMKILISIGLTFDILHFPSASDPDSYLINNSLENIDVSLGKSYFLENVTNEEFIDIVRNSENPSLIPDSLFNHYRVSRSMIKSDPIQNGFVVKQKIFKQTPIFNLALFLDAFPEYLLELPASVEDAYLEEVSTPEVLNLLFKNPYKNLKDPQAAFNMIIKEVH